MVVCTAFSTAAAFGLVLTIGFVVGIEALNAVDYYNMKVEDASTVRSEILEERIHTSIDVTNVTYGNGKFTVSVDNAGSTTLDLDKVYITANDTWIDEGSVVKDMSNEYWDPEETLKLNFTASDSNTIFKVMVENGIIASYSYTT